MRLVTFTAHPHYAAVNCAGTIYNHTQRGDEVYLVSLSAGELMTNKVPQTELIKINMKEFQDAAKILGVKEVRNLGFKDSYISDTEEVRMAINNVVRELKPGIVLTHWPKSTHSDFIDTAQATINACMFALVSAGKWAEKYPSHWVGNLYGFEVPELTIDFEPTVLIDITESMSRKIEATKCFKMHYEAIPGRNVDKWVSANCTGPSRYWGLKANVMYAEPFSQIKIHEAHLKPTKYLS